MAQHVCKPFYSNKSQNMDIIFYCAMMESILLLKVSILEMTTRTAEQRCFVQ